MSDRMSDTTGAAPAADPMIGKRVRVTRDLLTQPEGYPEMLVAPKGTEGVVVGTSAFGPTYDYVVHMPTRARGKPAGYTEDVEVSRNEIEAL